MRSDRLLVLLALLASACGPPGSPPQDPEGPPPSPAVVRCTADAAAHDRARLQAVQPKLTGALQHRLHVWQGELSRARCSGAQAEEIGLLERERVTLEIRFSGELTTLAAAGLNAGHHEDGSVSGQLDMGRLLDFAALPEVLAIEIQPEVQPNRDALAGGDHARDGE